MPKIPTNSSRDSQLRRFKEKMAELSVLAGDLNIGFAAVMVPLDKEDAPESIYSTIQFLSDGRARMPLVDTIQELSKRYGPDEVGMEKRIGTALCDVHGCSEVSTCIVGDGQGHPSCDFHSKSSDFVFPPPKN